jgi:hypothetical protein
MILMNAYAAIHGSGPGDPSAPIRAEIREGAFIAESGYPIQAPPG